MLASEAKQLLRQKYPEAKVVSMKVEEDHMSDRYNDATNDLNYTRYYAFVMLGDKSYGKGGDTAEQAYQLVIAEIETPVAVAA